MVGSPQLVLGLVLEFLVDLRKTPFNEESKDLDISFHCFLPEPTPELLVLVVRVDRRLCSLPN